MEIQKQIKKNSYLQIFSGEASKYLAKKIANAANRDLGISNLQRFRDGEFQPTLLETVRGSHVFIVQSTVAPSDNFVELLLMIDAAKRASAYKVIAVIPYYGFARQDRKDRPRVPIGAKLFANLLKAAGVDRIMTMDLHSDQIQGFFDVPVDHLYSSAIFVPYIQNMKLDNLLVASPDIGGSKRANAYSRFLNAELAICHKTRLRPNVVENMSVIGNVKDRNVVLIDDMIDTGGTILKACDLLKHEGAKSVHAFGTHALFSNDAVEKIDNSNLDSVVVTDTIPLKKKSTKIKVLSVANLFAEIIIHVYKYKSISHKFLD